MIIIVVYHHIGVDATPHWGQTMSDTSFNTIIMDNSHGDSQVLAVHPDVDSAVHV